jgi:hypothetical protein
MTTDLLGTASGFEILFFLSALVGLRFSIPNFGRRAIAVEGIALEIIFIGIHSLYVIAALVAFSIPAAPVVTAAGILIQSILVIVSWGITGCSWIIRRTGTYLLEHGLQARGPDGRFVRDD